MSESSDTDNSSDVTDGEGNIVGADGYVYSIDGNVYDGDGKEVDIVDSDMDSEMDSDMDSDMDSGSGSEGEYENKRWVSHACEYNCPHISDELHFVTVTEYNLDEGIYFGYLMFADDQQACLLERICKKVPHFAFAEDDYTLDDIELINGLKGISRNRLQLVECPPTSTLVGILRCLNDEDEQAIVAGRDWFNRIFVHAQGLEEMRQSHQSMIRQRPWADSDNKYYMSEGEAIDCYRDAQRRAVDALEYASLNRGSRRIKACEQLLQWYDQMLSTL